MHTYNAIVRLGGELHNEVTKPNLTAPELLLLRKIHGDDAVVKIEPSGFWEDHFGTRKVKEVNPETGLLEEVQRDFDYDDDVEKDRLAHIYGDAVLKEDDQGIPRAAIDRMFGEYAPLPAELPEFKKARKEAAAEKAAAKPSGKSNLNKVA